MKKAHILWEQGVALGQIARQCGLKPSDIHHMAKSLGWSSRDPERLPARKFAPLSTDGNDAIIRGIIRDAIAALHADARSIVSAITRLRGMLEAPSMASLVAAVEAGQHGSRRKIDDHTATVVRSLWNAGVPTRDIALRFGVTDQTIRNLASAQKWPPRKAGGRRPRRSDATEPPIRRVAPGVSGIPE